MTDESLAFETAATGRVLDAIGSAVVLTGADQRITWCNPAFSRLTGYSLSEARGRTSSELLQCEKAGPIGQAFNGRIAYRPKNGQTRWLNLDIAPLRNAGEGVQGFVSTLTDVTDSVLGFEYLSAVINSAAAGIVVQDAEGVILSCNTEAERLIGCTESDLVGRSAFDPGWRLCREDGSLIDGDAHPSIRALRSGQDLSGEVIGVQLPGGSWRWLQVHCRLIDGRSAGSRAVISSFTDITAHKLALTELAAERRRLNAALDGTQAGVWEWNLQTGEARVDDRWAIIGGYTVAELEPVSLKTWMRLIHPEDLPRLKEHQQRHAGGELAFLDVTCRIRHKAGRWIWVCVRGRIASRSEDGRPLWMYGTHVDIDDAKTSELELQRANTQLQGLFELSPVGIALNDLSDARFLEFNDALLAMTGYSRDELAALRHRDVCPPDARPEVAKQRQQMLTTGRYGPYESEFLHKNGSTIAVQLAGMRVALPDGSERIWSIIQDIGPRKRLERQLRHEARTDKLTGLPNRALLMERLQESVARVRSDAAQRFALLFVDFDRFKLVNDTLGHDTGDQLLRLIAERLREALRADDVLGGGGRLGNLVARFGGDEFVVLLNDVVSAEQAGRVAQRLLNIFAVPYIVRHKEIHSSASIGIVCADASCESAATVLRNADMAMYEAKRAGRSTLAFFDPGMQVRLTRAVRVEEALRRAIQLEQLSLVYQPIVDLGTGQVTSAEALLRWQHPELGAVSPNEFIPIAEESGLILAIGEWVLWQACRQWRRWQQQAPGLAPGSISVNLSRVQMSQGDRLLAQVAAAIQSTGMQAHQLQLEVTEREVMRDPAGARQLMDRLRTMGVKLAMDDFGTGTSSLGCLREYPFDVIKIDKSFIDGLSGSSDMLAVIHATVSVIENLGMISVAEGIEQAMQVGVLQSLGCHYGQGYFFSRPLAGDRLLDAVRLRECSG